MNLLIVVATELEIKDIRPHLEQKEIDIIVTGAGAPSTILSLTTHLSKNRYDYILNIGIGGSYSHKTPLTAVVEVINDRFADLGIETESNFTPFKEFDFCPENIKQLNSSNNRFKSNLPILPGYTYNTVHGNENSIKQLDLKEGIESMEGAAVKLVANHFKIPSIQVRAISNYVEKRSKENWQISEAITNLHIETKHIIDTLLKE